MVLAFVRKLQLFVKFRGAHLEVLPLSTLVADLQNKLCLLRSFCVVLAIALTARVFAQDFLFSQLQSLAW